MSFLKSPTHLVPTDIRELLELRISEDPEFRIWGSPNKLFELKKSPSTTLISIFPPVITLLKVYAINSRELWELLLFENYVLKDFKNKFFLCVTMLIKNILVIVDHSRSNIQVRKKCVNIYFNCFDLFYVCILHFVCMCITCMWYLEKPQDGIKSPGTTITDSCEPTYRC